jgi:hypothetical protein
MPPRPLHPAPNVRDDRDTPLLWERDGGDLEVIWVSGEEEYFLKWDWTGKSSPASLICPTG